MLSFAFRLFGNIFAGSVLLFVIGSLVPVFAQSIFYLLEFFCNLFYNFFFNSNCFNIIFINLDCFLVIVVPGQYLAVVDVNNGGIYTSRNGRLVSY